MYIERVLKYRIILLLWDVCYFIKFSFRNIEILFIYDYEIFLIISDVINNIRIKLIF